MERYEITYWKEDGTALSFDVELSDERCAFHLFNTIKMSPGVKHATLALYSWLPSKQLVEWKIEETNPSTSSRCVP